MTGAAAGPGRAGVLRAALAEVLRDREVDFEEDGDRPGAFLVTLPGTHKLATKAWFVLGDHSLHIEAFFVRRPEENREAFYAWLLRRNMRMFGVAFALDHLGDVYLAGRLPLDAVTPEAIDQLLGSVLSSADELFDVALELGFRTSIEREWAWRVKRGESLANLRAFQHLFPESSGGGSQP